MIGCIFRFRGGERRARVKQEHPRANGAFFSERERYLVSNGEDDIDDKGETIEDKS